MRFATIYIKIYINVNIQFTTYKPQCTTIYSIVIQVYIAVKKRSNLLKK
jgi:hypothetical protein